MDFSEPKNKSKKKKEESEENNEVEETPYEILKLDIFIDIKEPQTNLENF